VEQGGRRHGAVGRIHTEHVQRVNRIDFRGEVTVGLRRGLRNGLLPGDQNLLPNTAQQNANVGHSAAIDS